MKKLENNIENKSRFFDYHEVWKDIEGYEGIYKVSNLGRIKSYDRTISLIRLGTTVKRHVKGSLKKASISNNGYLQISLFKEDKKKDFLVHRLVASAFIPNTYSKRTVNHIDGDKLNNYSSNLEWATYSENHKHAYDDLNKKAYMTGRTNELNHNSKGVVMRDELGNELNRFPSISEAERSTGILNSSIVACLKGRNKTAGGYKWNYVK